MGIISDGSGPSRIRGGASLTGRIRGSAPQGKVPHERVRRARLITMLDRGWHVVIYKQRDIRHCSCCSRAAVVRPLFAEIVIPTRITFAICTMFCVPQCAFPPPAKWLK